MNFSQSLLNKFKARKKNLSLSYVRDGVDRMLHDLVSDSADELEHTLAKHCQDEDIDEKDLLFIIETARHTENPDKIIRRSFDIALTKKKFSYSKEYKKLLMQHFAKRDKVSFEKYLQVAINPIQPLLLVEEDNGKYITNKIVIAKISLTKPQADFILMALDKTNISNEAHYISYLKTIDYLNTFSSRGHEIFEKKFNEFFDNRSYVMGNAIIIKMLRSCSDSMLRGRLARRFVKAPYGEDKSLKSLVKHIPEISKLINLK